MKVLIVVDMQNDFIDGALGTPEAVQIVDRVRTKIDQYLKEGNEVIYTRDTHEQDYLNTQEGKNLPVPHCIRGTHGWDIFEGIYRNGCAVIDKPSFGSMELTRKVAALGDLESIELVGLCTDICVISNAFILKAGMPETLICVDSTCCAGVSPQSHQNALEAMKMCQITVF